MRILNTILLVLILLVVGGGAGYYYFTNGNDQAVAAVQEPAAPVVAAPVFLALEPFTVTIMGERNSQIFYTEITLRLQDMNSHSTLVQYMPEVRNRVLAEVAQHRTNQLQTSEGRVELANRLKTVLSAPYHPHMAAPVISNVLFTAFVIQ